MTDEQAVSFGSTLNAPADATGHGPWPARGAVIEIIERGRATDDSIGGSVIAPDEIRINGQALLSSGDHPVKVHDVEIEDRSLVYVTLTLLARRVTIAAEDDL
ncbi:hypothetical protein [Streptomyces sp. STCH 565 A]|uniref:hypothetical protein n=1 Tax=Streptomyces sp. STCH 565 A TaxID=2950532 RepID=UPI002074F5A2|nr:hypothetical protein [Streptomyces sp. STCH 565 A]MCM8552323.1 hypothetical protein [Streptomyces sp. STCH 565 A]